MASVGGCFPGIGEKAATISAAGVKDATKIAAAGVKDATKIAAAGVKDATKIAAAGAKSFGSDAAKIAASVATPAIWGAIVIGGAALLMFAAVVAHRGLFWV